MSPHNHFLCPLLQEYSKPNHPGSFLLTLLQFANVLLALGGIKTGQKIQSYVFIFLLPFKNKKL